MITYNWWHHHKMDNMSGTFACTKDGLTKMIKACDGKGGTVQLGRGCTTVEEIGRRSRLNRWHCCILQIDTLQGKGMDRQTEHLIWKLYNYCLLYMLRQNSQDISSIEIWLLLVNKFMINLPKKNTLTSSFTIYVFICRSMIMCSLLTSEMFNPSNFLTLH